MVKDPSKAQKTDSASCKNGNNLQGPERCLVAHVRVNTNFIEHLFSSPTYSSNEEGFPSSLLSPMALQRLRHE